MSSRRVIWLVARREVSERLRQKSFQYSLAATVGLVVVAAFIAGLVGGDETKKYDVGAQGAEGVAIVDAARASAGSVDAEITVKRFDSPAAARAVVEDEDVDAAVAGGAVISRETPDEELDQALQAGARQVRAGEALSSAGVDEAEAREALNPPPLRAETTEEAKGKGAEGVAFVAAIMLYGALVVFGIGVAQGVVEEKASRVIEVLLSTIRPRPLLMGKILGIGVLGLLQLLAAAVAGLAVGAARGVVDVDATIVGAVAIALVWFLFGYAFWAALYAISGVIVSRQEDLTASSTPLTILLVASYLVAIPAVNAPASQLAVISSIVPFSSPVVMPVRAALGEASAAEMAISLGVLALGALLLLRLGARIYEAAVLRMGKPLKLTEAWRAAS